MNQTPRTWLAIVDSDGSLLQYPYPNPSTITVTELPEGYSVVPESEINGLNKLVDRYLDKIREMDVAAVKCAAELSDLRRWKAETMEVTRELDTQAIGHELDLVLGDNVYSAILPGIRRLKADALFWEDISGQWKRNADYYRDLLDRVAVYLGDDVFTCDDGSISDSPLRAKIPELVSALASRASDLQGRIDLAAAKLDGALDDLAGSQPVTIEELYKRAVAKEDAEIPVREPETLKIEVGGAYLTRGGRVAIVTKSYDDLKTYSKFARGDDGGGYTVTAAGEACRGSKLDWDLVSRIPFPECPSDLPSPPDGFVYVGHGPLPVRGCDPDVCGRYSNYPDWVDDGLWDGTSKQAVYAVRIGSPVHFALARQKGGLA
jgi:hypothetical protein